MPDLSASSRTTVEDQVVELKRRLDDLLQDRNETLEHVLGKLDEFYWLRSDIEPFINSSGSPAVLPLRGMDRLCHVLDVPLDAMLGGLDGDARPLPERIKRPMEGWNDGEHVDKM